MEEDVEKGERRQRKVGGEPTPISPLNLSFVGGVP
ncbi:MAG: hypothetical protein ACI8QF_001876, partial [Limisphaerales bacterium]